MLGWSAASPQWLSVLTVEHRFVLTAVSNAAGIHFAVNATIITPRIPASKSPFKTNVIYSQAAVLGSPDDQASSADKNSEANIRRMVYPVMRG
jgi:hypothetical protein